MKLFHNTFAADAILRDGFRDGRGWIEDLELVGVWLSDRPLEEQDGAKGDTRLSVEIPEAEIAEYEVFEDGKTYREWCVPAAIVNRSGHVRLASGDDEEAFYPYLGDNEDVRKALEKLHAAMKERGLEDGPASPLGSKDESRERPGRRC